VEERGTMVSKGRDAAYSQFANKLDGIRGLRHPSQNKDVPCKCNLIPSCESILGLGHSLLF
jgi:hypothetical protein